MQHLEALGRAGRAGRGHRFALRAQSAGHRRVARHVEPFEDARDRRERNVVEVAAAYDSLFAAQATVGDAEALESGHDRPAQGTPDPDGALVATGVTGFVAEQEEIERAALGLVRADGVDDRRRGGLGIPFLAIGDEVDGAGYPDRHRVPELLERLGRAETQHDGLAAGFLDKAHGRLDRALLVRTDGEPEVLAVDGAGVLGQGDPAGHGGDALDADEDLHRHARMRWFSGSKSGRAPTTAIVTGYRSAKYSTNSLPPSTARSGGR